MSGARRANWRTELATAINEERALTNSRVEALERRVGHIAGAVGVLAVLLLMLIVAAVRR